MRTLRVVEVLKGDLRDPLEPYTAMNLAAASASQQHLGLHEGMITTEQGIGSFFVFAFFEHASDNGRGVEITRSAALELEPEERVALLGLSEVVRLAQGDPRTEISYVRPVPFNEIQNRLEELDDSAA